MNGKSILIIEDEHFISELYARALEKEGYSVTIMMSGEDGLRAAVKGNFDLVLLDLLVPGLSGIDVLKQIRESDITSGKHTIVIITTNLEQDQDTRVDLERNVDGYLIKAEMTPKELVGVVNQVLKNN